jgi:hypothetical protein
MTALGLAVAALFFFVSRAEPLEKLAPQRPPARIFCLQVCLSIVGQFLVHLACLMTTLELAKPLVARTRADPAFAPDGPFRPNVVNTAIFLLSAVTQVKGRVGGCVSLQWVVGWLVGERFGSKGPLGRNPTDTFTRSLTNQTPTPPPHPPKKNKVNTFTANYRGEPFMQALWDNRPLRVFTLGLYATLLALSLEVFPPLNTYLQLVPLPSPFRRQLTQLLLLDTGAVLLVEKACLRFFPT